LELVIWLSLSESGDDLCNSEPEILINIVACILNKLDDDINIPIEVLCKLFSKNSYLEDDFFFQLIVVFLEIIQDFVHDLSRHLGVTKTEK
jgi:hypothetical protein